MVGSSSGSGQIRAGTGAAASSKPSKNLGKSAASKTAKNGGSKPTAKNNPKSKPMFVQSKPAWLLKPTVEEQRKAVKPVSVMYDALTAEQMARVSTVKVQTNQMYDQTRDRIAFGPLDARFGPSERGVVCTECNQTMLDCPGCPGHFGFVPLTLPNFHPGFYRHVYQMAQALCKSCGRLPLPDGGEVEVVAAGAAGEKGAASSRPGAAASRPGAKAKAKAKSGPAMKRQRTIPENLSTAASAAAPATTKPLYDFDAPRKKTVSRQTFERQMIAATRANDPARKVAVRSAVLEACKKMKFCAHCYAQLGGVKKSTGIPLAFKYERFGNPKLTNLPPDNFVLAEALSQAWKNGVVSEQVAKNLVSSAGGGKASKQHTDLLYVSGRGA